MMSAGNGLGKKKKETLSAKLEAVDAVKYWTEKAIMTSDQIHY